MSVVDLIILIDDKKTSSEDIITFLENLGCTIKQELPRFGIIFCYGDESLIEQIKSKEGVKHVRPSQNFQLPPMDPKLPQ